LGRRPLQALGLPSTHGTFYVEVVEAVLKARSTFAITKQLYGQYIGFHALLMHIASLGRDDLMPGRIVAFGVGGFIKENVARQMEVLYSIPGTVTKESLSAAYLGKSTVKARLDAINKFHGIEDMSEDEWKAWWDRHQACEEPHQLEQQMGAIVLRGTPVIPATDGDKVDDDMEVDMPPYEGEISTSDEEEEVDEA
jgi:hypothetical protein